MSEFFRSAFSYLSGTTGEENEFVGQVVDLGNGNKLKIKKVIAEGGFGYVFVAQEVNSTKIFALKRLIVTREHIEAVKQEIAFLKALSGHPNIIQYVAAAAVPASKTSHGSTEFLIETELCNGGPLLNVLGRTKLTQGQVLRVFYETCSAVAHMHNQSPPIIHRDLKVENLLLGSKGEVKLCDFGSATDKRLIPDESWSHAQRTSAEEELQRNTTPMYRAPEMINLYSNHPVDEHTDVWALGCLLFKLCYSVHPFEDSSKLSIINANYKLPEDDSTYTVFHPLIRACLVVDPCKRPPINEIIAHLYSIAQQLNEDFNDKPNEPLPLSGLHDGEGEWLEQTAQQAQRFLGIMKGGAGHLIRNIRDTSSKVMQSVAGKKTELDISYITSRILVMSLPSEDQTQTQHNVDEVCSFLDTRHPEQYLVFNLSDHSYDVTRLHNQVADFDWPIKCMPDMEKLVDLCRSLDSWLRADRQNVIVIHCTDGKLVSSSAVVAYLVFLGAFASPLTGYKLYNFKRGSPDQAGRHGNVIPPASHMRYIQCISDVVRKEDGSYGNGVSPHSHPIALQSLKMTSVPVFNMNRSGCKPFVEVFQNGTRIFTSTAQADMDKLRSYTAEDEGIVVPIETNVSGNILIVVHHVRSIPLVKMAGRGMSAVRMFQLQFHTGFVNTDWMNLSFSRSKLDGSSVLNESKFPSPFRVMLALRVDRSQEFTLAEQGASWDHLPHPQDSPLTCFSSLEEQRSVMSEFAEFDAQATLLHKQSEAALQSTPSTSSGPHQQQQLPTVSPSSTSPPTGYASYHDRDSTSSTSSSSSDDDSDHGNQRYASHHLGQKSHSDNNLTRRHANELPRQQESQLLNFDPAPVETQQVSPHPPPTHNRQPSPWQPTAGQDFLQASDDLATVFGNPSAVKTDQLLDIAFDDGKRSNSTPLLAQPQPLKPSSSIEDLLFGGVQSSPSSTGVSLDNLLGDLSTLHPQTPAHKEPVTSGLGMMGGPRVRPASGGGVQPGSRGGGDDLFAQFVGFQGSGAGGVVPSSLSQGNTPAGGSPWPGTSPRPGGSPIPPHTMSSSAIGTQRQYVPQSKVTQQPPQKSKHPSDPLSGGTKKPMAPKASSYTSVIGNREERGPRSSHQSTGVRSKFKKDDFQDLLGAEGFTVPSKDKEPQTLSSMQDIGDLTAETDPDRAKVKVWAKGKEKNIRALISSLPLVLWEGENRWEKVGMHQLVQPEEVRRFYKRACLAVHPDKAIGLPHENLARYIFVALNEAHTIYEESGAQPLI